jgi:hypothetical protein
MLRRQDALEAAQHRTRLLDQFERERGRLHANPALEQQGIAELVAEPGKGVADRRFCPAKSLRRAGHAPLGHQNIEHNQ